MTLERTHRRKDACLGSLSTVHIPPDTLEPVCGRDDRDYEKSRQLCEAAVSDGFEVFGRLIEAGEHNRRGITDICQAWNFYRLWQKVIDFGKPCMIIQDDWTLAYPICFWDIDAIATELRADLLLLGGSEDYAPFRAKTVRCTDSRGTQCVKGIINNQDMAMVVSPIGAQYLMDMMDEFYAAPEVNTHNFQEVLFLFGEREYEKLKKLGIADYDRFEHKSVYTVIGHYINPIFDPESELWKEFPSVVHKDNITLVNERWPLIRTIEETRD